MAKVYHHIFDRNTGYPIDNQLASLTIVSDKSVDGEIWTTRLLSDSPSSILEKDWAESSLRYYREDNPFLFISLTPESIS